MGTDPKHVVTSINELSSKYISNPDKISFGTGSDAVKNFNFRGMAIWDTNENMRELYVIVNDSIYRTVSKDNYEFGVRSNLANPNLFDPTNH